MRLYIIGNGFDSNHEIKTKYEDYCKYLKKNKNENLVEKFEKLTKQYGCVTDCWKNIEETLSINYEDIIKKTSSYQISDVRGNKFECVKSTLDGDLSFINAFTGSKLYEWLASLSYDNAMPKFEEITNESIYVSFNYTMTLEKIYHIDKKNILHIHGSLDEIEGGSNPEIRKKLLFGASTSEMQDIVTMANKYKKYPDEDARSCSFYNIQRELIRFQEKSTKNISKNFEVLSSFLDGKKVDEICIMGHSLLSVDDPYYENVLIPLYKNIHWIYYNYHHVDDFERFCKKYSIVNFAEKEW